MLFVSFFFVDLYFIFSIILIVYDNTCRKQNQVQHSSRDMSADDSLCTKDRLEKIPLIGILILRTVGIRKVIGQFFVMSSLTRDLVLIGKKSIEWHGEFKLNHQNLFFIF